MGPISISILWQYNKEAIHCLHDSSHNAAVNEFPDTPHRGAMWGIYFLGVPKTQKSPQPGAHFMSKPPDNPQVKPAPNRVG